MYRLPIVIFFSSLFLCCNNQTNAGDVTVVDGVEVNKSEIPFDTMANVIHIFVALCDNKYQEIVPVPAKIGNGQDPSNNLYWGCQFGVRAYFKRSKDWKLIRTQGVDSIKLERLVFKHKAKNSYLIADAYDGRYIKRCTRDFLNSSCGKLKDTLQIGDKTIGVLGNSQLLSYIGHDGLMDFKLADKFENTDGKERDVIILACYSKRFFSPHLKDANVNPLVWTTGLMAPEAYVIHDAISAYLNNEGIGGAREKAAQAYSKYQKCSLRAARNLLVTGW